jgi:hypothetical protein
MLPRFVLINDNSKFRSRADDTHLTAHHVNQLRNLVQAPSSYDAPNAGMTRIFSTFMRHSAFRTSI